MRSRRAWTGFVVIGLGLATVGACSTSGRDLPAPTTTRPTTPQVMSTVTVP